MRMLFTTTSGAGHFLPLVPLAEAARAAGHDVAVAAPEESTAMVEGAGFKHLPFGGVPSDDPTRTEVLRRLPTLTPEEAGTLMGKEVFGRLNTSAALPGTVQSVSEWQPDLVISESGEFSGQLAAEAAGLPRLRVHPGLSRAGFDRIVALGLTDLRLGLGLDPDPSGASLHTPPQVGYFPEAFDPSDEGSPPVLRIRDPRYRGFTPGHRSDVVYVTLGSEAASMPFFADALRSAVSGAVAAGFAVLVSTGRQGDPRVLAGLPGDVRAERWVDTAEVMATARAVVCHAGAGTTLAALAAGVPIVAVPLFAEQPLNAERIAAVDAGVVVQPGPGLDSRVEAAVRSVTTAAPPGTARMAADIAGLADVSAALELAERLVDGSPTG
ncbi:MAG: hypothetical protein AVDCRST_MAG50-2541 [uncultured Acidimicrobiales bacterium]|uniref:Glycosyltransferase n=1 Tax=uncultured Acidimicrobiales bacterium TaxID=310071 RepID=A0A6J4IDW4_9ACTN|nr:MAG: hypothetical protein AVDCRST_MAG50-2541 [uncultured Acidimicrobiales bacterium]